MTDLKKVEDTLQVAGVPLAQLGTLAPQVQKNANAIRAQENVRKFSDLTGRSEGTLDNKYGIANPYAVGFGGKEIKDFSKHPGIRVKFNELSPDGSVGQVNTTDAGGKHQWLGKTWKAYDKKYGVLDFSPQSQEIRFAQLLKDNKVLTAVENGDFVTAIDVLGKKQQFASFPTSTANQPKRSPEEFAKMAKASGIDLGAVVSGIQQPLSDQHIVAGLLPTPQQAAQEQAQTQQQEAAAQSAQLLAQEAAQQQQQIALEDQQRKEADFERQSKIDSIGAMLQEETLGTIGKTVPLTTKYDNQILALIRAA
jgi:muramidase (phage lysozyme)